MFKKGILAGVLAFGVVVSVPGCSKDDEEPEFRQLEGTAEKLDLETGEVALRFFHKKTGKEQVLYGIVTDQTEVLINGRLAELKDIRLKERVKVTGYKKGSGLKAQMVAIRVEVERPEWIETGSSAEAPPADPADASPN